VHVGAGTGYYSAILAEIVGAAGHVTAIEIDPDLAERARHNLAARWPQAAVVVADGFGFRPDRPADAIIVNAGVSHVSMAWLDALAGENGRLLVPLTNADRWGGSLMIERRAGETQRYPVRYAGQIGIIPCIGGSRSQRRGTPPGRLGAFKARHSPFAAARAGRAGRDVLARRQGLVVVDGRRRREPLLIEFVRRRATSALE
jgi:protein-L-isoaspartate(D-aspartate) O-methyltransferase